MEFDRAKIRKMHWRDMGLILVFLVFSWWVLGYIIVEVGIIASSNQIREVALTAGLIALIFVTSSLMAVLVHLKKNRDALYCEELLHAARRQGKS